MLSCSLGSRMVDLEGTSILDARLPLLVLVLDRAREEATTPTTSLVMEYGAGSTGAAGFLSSTILSARGPTRPLFLRSPLASYKIRAVL
jgi:hypothetical protein